MTTITDTAELETPVQLDTAPVEAAPAETAPEALVTTPKTPPEILPEVVPEPDTSKRERGLLRERTRLNEEMRTLREENASLRAKVDAVESYVKTGMTEEDEAQFEAKRQESLKGHDQLKAADEFHLGVVTELVDTLVDGGVLELDPDLLADLKIGNWPTVYEALWERYPELDAKGFFGQDQIRAGVAHMRKAAQKKAQTARDGKLEASFSKQIAELKALLTEKEKQHTEELVEERQQAAAEIAALRAVSTTTGGGGGDADALLWRRYGQGERLTPSEIKQAQEYAKRRHLI